MAQGLAVRDDEERGAAQPQLDELLQALLGPERFARQPERRFLFRRRLRAVEALRQDRDLARHGTEEPGVRELQRPRGRAAAEGLGPAGHAGQRLDHAHANDQERDPREDDHEHQEAEPLVLPDPPLGLDQRPCVEHDEHHADVALVAQHGARIHIGRAAVYESEPAPRLPAVERRHHIRKYLRDHGADVRRRGLDLDGLGAVEDLEPPPLAREGLLHLDRDQAPRLVRHVAVVDGDAETLGLDPHAVDPRDPLRERLAERLHCPLLRDRLRMTERDAGPVDLKAMAARVDRAGDADARSHIAEISPGDDGQADLRRPGQRGEMSLHSLPEPGFGRVRHVRRQRAVIVGHEQETAAVTPAIPLSNP